jgi:hypothetical protein
LLCIGCLERRLGRELEPVDFTDAPLNYGSRKSERLRQRLGSRFRGETPRISLRQQIEEAMSRRGMR